MKRVLCVDDEPNLLQALERQLRKQFEIHTAVGAEAALQKLAAEGPFAVVVSDLRMPGMNGTQLLSAVRERYPDTVRIMLTGQADLAAAIQAVNEGNIFQFLTKPCPAESLARTLAAALEHHRLVLAERELLEQTLQGSIEVMIEILSLVNPPAFSKAHRIRKYVRHMALKQRLPDIWQYEVAAMLSQIGCVAVPPDIMDKRSLGIPLNPEEEDVLAGQSRLGGSLLRRIPRLETVAGMVGGQGGSWKSSGQSGDVAAIGGHMLRIALDLDAGLIQGGAPSEVLAGMKRAMHYHAGVLASLEDFPFHENRGEARSVNVVHLRRGMIITADVRGKNGVLVLAKGQEVTESVIARLQSFARTTGIFEPLRVVVPYGAETREPLETEAASSGVAIHR